MDGRVQRSGLIAAFRCAAHDHGVVSHGAADESLLAGERGRCSLPNDDDFARLAFYELSLAPREVVMVVHELLLVAAQDFNDLASDPLAARVRILARELHQLPVVVA